MPFTSRIEQHAKECVRCGNCSIVCPTHAVKMVADKEGFLYPSVDDTACIRCGICHKACPMYNAPALKQPIKCLAVRCEDETTYRRGASGGVFGMLATQFLKTFEGSKIYGAAYQSGVVRHISVGVPEEVFRIQGSKYVQSELGTVFLDVRETLDESKPVLFCGTPCQVHALRLFLGKEYSQLYTADIICHGVPSPSLLAHDLHIYGSTAPSDLVFRDKGLRAAGRSAFILKLMYEKRCKRIIANRDPYYYLFLNGQSYRESCYLCPFACRYRCGDITLGDCDSYRRLKTPRRNEALNSVLVNARSGAVLWSLARDEAFEVELDIDEECAVNHQLVRPSERPALRDQIYGDAMTKTVDDFRKQYAKKRGLRDMILLARLDLFG